MSDRAHLAIHFLALLDAVQRSHWAEHPGPFALCSHPLCLEANRPRVQPSCGWHYTGADPGTCDPGKSMPRSVRYERVL